jgi:hypothetical protein
VTLVTLDCTRVDIAMSVNPARGAVYSPAVLHPEGQTVVDRVARLTLVTVDCTAFNIPNARAMPR